MKSIFLLALAASWTQAFPRPGKSNGALYFLDSDPHGASVVSFGIASDGLLGKPVRTSTGGNGMIGNNANGSVNADPLFSQGSVIVDGNLLFTVNAGSNTLAAFKIPKHDPTHPVLIGEPMDTVGTTPNTVAYSRKHKTACVANTGTKPGVQCFSVSGSEGVKPVGGLRALPVLNQTNPILGPPNTVSNIVFNPSETALFVVIKGDGMQNGYIYAYKIENGIVSEEAVVSRPENLPIPFTMTFSGDNSALVATPAYGAAFVSISEDYRVSTDVSLNITAQMATCWTAKSPDTGSVYLLDAGVPNVNAVNTETKAISRTLPGYEQGMGNFDGIVSGSKLYTLQAAPAVAIFDLDDPAYGPQVIDLTNLGNRASWIGMAAYAQGPRH
ncbi:3-carboxymuconate cyclase protein [Fusarium sporotrichioides]|uniref:3-carboxymuconate cyclase protein n=1 Tax=Fusarium sporotrichioides TaxID=5514 RepID=A0A395RG27_FUSSP|nr:3-carboxymuconate cyclase protein [Fusarium sporotrichioides]